MKRIKKIFTTDFCYDLNESQSSLLFYTFYLYTLKNELIWERKEVILRGEYILNLKIEIEKRIEELLDAGYMLPPVSQRQKKPTRYEKIVFKGKQYIVDYRTSAFGRTVYFLHDLTNSLLKTLDLGDNVVVTLEGEED